jgi:hypothetical protein
MPCLCPCTEYHPIYVPALNTPLLCHHAEYHILYFCHQTLRNEYAQLEFTFVLSPPPLFISPKCNANVIMEGSYDIHKLLISVQVTFP